MSEVTIDQLEQQLAAEKVSVEMRDMAIKLSGNREFKKLILDGFCGTEAARYVQESGDPALTAEQRQDALNIAQASGHLKRYLSVVVLMGNMSARNVADLNVTLNEARAEEGAE